MGAILGTLLFITSLYGNSALTIGEQIYSLMAAVVCFPIAIWLLGFDGQPSKASRAQDKSHKLTMSKKRTTKKLT